MYNRDNLRKKLSRATNTRRTREGEGVQKLPAKTSNNDRGKHATDQMDKDETDNNHPTKNMFQNEGTKFEKEKLNGSRQR